MGKRDIEYADFVHAAGVAVYNFGSKYMRSTILDAGHFAEKKGCFEC